MTYALLLLSIIILFWSHRSPFVGLAIIFTAAIINIWNVVLPYIDLGLKVYLYDFVFIAIFFAGLARHLVSKNVPKISVIFSLFSLIFFAKFFNGIAPYGTASGVEFRQYFYVLSSGLYFSAFSYSEENLLKLLKVYIFFAVIVLCIVYYRFVAEYMGLSVAAKWIKADGGDIRFRVIASYDALILSVATITIMVIALTNNAFELYKKLFVFFILAIIALQHRSVWMATFIPVFLIPFMPGIEVSKAFTRQITTVGFVFLCGLIIYEYGFFQKITEMVHLSATRATNLHEGTFYARTQSWEYLLSMWGRFDAVTQFFGTTFGSGYGGLSAYPHNFTLQLLFRGGVFAVVVFYLLYGSLIAGLFRKSISQRGISIYYSLFILLLISQLVYYIPYGVSPFDGIVLGMAISLAKKDLVGQETAINVEQDKRVANFNNLLT